MNKRTGDASYIKKINRSLILKNIVEHGMISRADLSKIVGLNKATISVQVADLLEENLIYETQLEHFSIGRRPIMLAVNGKAGYVLGIDVDHHQIQFTVCDLTGRTIQSDTLNLQSDNYDEIVQILIKHIKRYARKYAKSHFGLVSVVIGIHGTINKDESILFVPKYNWHRKNLKLDLEQELENIDIFIENNANLSANAERVYHYHHSNNLLTIILTSGIGAGIMIDGKLHKGYNGYAGEMGHMIIVPDGEPCKCGNLGCWERYASEPTLVSQLSKQLNIPGLTHKDVQTMIVKQDPIINEYIDQFIKYLSIGLNNIINLYNPESLVLNSELLRLYPNAIQKIESNLTSSMSNYHELTISELGNEACVMGACALAIQRFLDVPELIYSLSRES